MNPFRLLAVIVVVALIYVSLTALDVVAATGGVPARLG